MDEMEYINYSIRMTTEQRERLERVAVNHNYDAAKLIRQAVDSWFRQVGEVPLFANVDARKHRSIRKEIAE